MPHAETIIALPKTKHRRGKVLDLELIRKRLESGLYLDHAIDSIGQGLAETLHNNEFNIIRKAENNGVKSTRTNPATSKKVKKLAELDINSVSFRLKHIFTKINQGG